LIICINFSKNNEIFLLQKQIVTIVSIVRKIVGQMPDNKSRQVLKNYFLCNISVASALADGKSEMILIIVESILSLPSATRPFGERLRTYGRLPDR
jgi:hypothetical protein